MENLQSYRIKFAIICEGFQYRLDDFRVRVGKVVPINSENLRGIAMEMEYLIISSWKTSHLIMSEFIEILMDTLEKKSLPEQPNKFYITLSWQRLIVEAESSTQMIMENLQSYRINKSPPV
uniref:Mediator of RNA polymerase II transcription subunit 20 n=1 Tax=Solanum lycopersicum TaxID=4081 RepID=A0A3Q7IIF2_SOLLC